MQVGIRVNNIYRIPQILADLFYAGLAHHISRVHEAKPMSKCDHCQQLFATEGIVWIL